MNVYVRELSSALARLGHDVDIFTRADNPYAPSHVAVEPGLRVHNIVCGPAAVIDHVELERHVGAFTEGVREYFLKNGLPDVIHANYWLSGRSGHQLKHEFNIPLVMTFHTLERVKAATFTAGSLARAQEEEMIVRCADAVLASCEVEATQLVDLYDATPAKVHIVPLGVNHTCFAPGNRAQARRALGLDDAARMLLFVGRIQELKGVDLALDTLIELKRRGENAFLCILGGPSGSDGRRYFSALHERVAQAGVLGSVHFLAPQGHQLLSTWMRASDVTLVPSRAESFGLVALESSACGTPVVASAVGGLTTLVHPGVNGMLLEDRSPESWANAVEAVFSVSDKNVQSAACVSVARSYTWRHAGEQVASLTSALEAHQLVCG
jgi:D-inositol-3-phosphate glycosyltransferase